MHVRRRYQKEVSARYPQQFDIAQSMTARYSEFHSDGSSGDGG